MKPAKYISDYMYSLHWIDITLQDNISIVDLFALNYINLRRTLL